MKQFHFLSFVAAIAVAALPAVAQQEAASNAPPANSASTPIDSSKAPMKRHDHAGEASMSRIGQAAIVHLSTAQGPKPCLADA